MNRHRSTLLLLALFCLALLMTGCFGKGRKDANLIPHTNYGGCKIQGRHYHNTHVFIGEIYEPSLSEWLKY